MSAPPTGLKQVFREVLRSKTGVIGIILLLFITSLALLTPFVAPFDIAKKWNDIQWWSDNPVLAAPGWMTIIMPDKYSTTIILDEFSSTTTQQGDIRIITLTGSFRYSFRNFPSEIKLVLDADYEVQKPQIRITLSRPDGEDIVIFQGLPNKGENIVNLSLDPQSQDLIVSYLFSNFGVAPSAVYPEVVLFAVKDANMNDRMKASVLRGIYRLNIDVIAFDDKTDVKPRLYVYGNAFGLFGTDAFRRDLIVGIMWGAPIALAFGTIAAVVTVLLQVIIGAAGTWFGTRSDELVQRAADFFLIIPVLPILILVNIIYGINIWALLGWVILFSLVGVSSKVARSMVLQIREEQYIEAAISYGASKKRMLFLYILPRMLPYMFALIALSAPIYIFLEAALSFLGLGDPNIPSWGRILGDAYGEGALYLGYWWWVIFPALMIILVSLGFTLLAYSFDKVVNPRLREE